MLRCTHGDVCCRFSERLVFPDFSVDDAVKLLLLQLQKQYGLELSQDALKQLPEMMQQVRRCTRQHCIVHIAAACMVALLHYKLEGDTQLGKITKLLSCIVHADLNHQQEEASKTMRACMITCSSSCCTAPFALQLVSAPGWSNGRDVGTWVKRIFRTYSLRLLEASCKVGQLAAWM